MLSEIARTLRKTDLGFGFSERLDLSVEDDVKKLFNTEISQMDFLNHLDTVLIKRKVGDECKCYVRFGASDSVKRGKDILNIRISDKKKFTIGRAMTLSAKIYDLWEHNIETSKMKLIFDTNRLLSEQL